MDYTLHASDSERRNLHAVLEGCPVGAAVVAHGRLCFANALFMESTRLAPGAEALRIVFDNAPSGAGPVGLSGKQATLFWDAPNEGEYRMRLVAHMAPYGGEDAFFLWLPIADGATQDAALPSPSFEQPAPGPISATPEAPLAPVQLHVPSAKSRGRILLVEDNEINQEIAIELLDLAGVQVVVASNGQEAVDVFLKQDFDLILMDIQMPVMDGLEATRTIRASGKAKAETVPILAMTAHGMDSDREKSLQVGMNDHLTKPIDPQRLYATLDTWLPSSTRARIEEAESAPDSVAASPIAAPSPLSPLQTAVPKETPPQDVLASLKGFDTQAGLSNVAGNRDLYLRLLGRFANNYRNSGVELRDALKRMAHDDAAHEEAVRLAHTAKGVAANLGARALAAVAGELESAIKKHKKLDAREEMLARYDLLLNEALDSIETLPKRDDARVGQKAISPLDKERIAAVLHTVPVLMEADWYGAQQRLLALAPLVEDTRVSVHFREITMALEEFDSAAVAENGKRLLAAI